MFLSAAFLAAGAGAAMAQSQPANTLSIATYGATGNDTTDDVTAIQNCFNAARTQGRGVWIPAGTYYVGATLSATDITITGAGMNSSTLFRDVNVNPSDGANYLDITRCTVRDIGLKGNAPNRAQSATGINTQGVGWLVERVRFEKAQAGMWASGSNGTIRNCQTVNTWADGLNINNGDGPNKLGAYLTVEDCNINGSGDDGIAINSQGISLGRQNMQDPKVLNNTQTNSFGANGLRIAGGINSLMQGNSVSDQVSTGENGIQVGKFSADGFQCVNGQVNNNTFTRVGGHNDTAGIWVYEDAICSFSGNNIIDSYQHGVRIGSCSITFGDNNTINHPAKRGVWVVSGSSGSANIKNNTVSNLNAGQPAFLNEAGGAMNVTTTGNSWQTGTGVVFYQNTNYGGSAGSALQPGNYTLSQLAAAGVANDWASSVRVPAGWSVQFYSDDNFSGQSWTRTADTPSFASLTPNANEQMSSCRVTGPSGATFYQNTNYGGAASQLLPVGTYTLVQMAARGLVNDWASSVRVQSGRTVTMYSDDNFSGQSWVRTADTPNFTTLTPNANDVVSSVRVD